MKLGNLIREQKNNVAKNRKKVAAVKREKEQDHHVVAIKNKLYENSAMFEQSTHGSSQAAGYQTSKNYISQSLMESERKGEALQRQRTDSAPNKNFAIKRPPAIPRGQSTK